MCYGAFHSSGENCASCRVSRSCKQESLKRIRSEKDRQRIQSVKLNTLERFSDDREAKKILFGFLCHYNLPVSTYRLTKDFKRHFRINVSDNKILELCLAMKAEHNLDFRKEDGARKWFVKRTAVLHNV